MAKFTDEEVIKASQNITATKAAATLGVHYSTYREHAKRLGVWKINPGGKGLTKNKSAYAIPLEEILEGKHPHYQTHKLKLRLFSSGKFQRVCSCCQLTTWLDHPISLELDHVDGNKYNHKLDNLRLLCPNCHSQTETYRGKNKLARVVER